MKLRNKILLGILAILILLVAFNYKLVRYGIEQGLGQLEMVRNAVPIDDLLADPEYPDSLKQKLLLIKEIRRYAIDSLHLKDSKNYNAVYDLKGRPTAYVVQACEKYRIKKYLWKFPVVGKLPYKNKVTTLASRIRRDGARWAGLPTQYFPRCSDAPRANSPT